MLSWELKYFSLRKLFSDVSQSCGKADFSSLGLSLHLSAQNPFLQWRPEMSWICAQALLGGLWAAQSQPSSSALPTELVTVENLLLGLLLHYCYTLGFSLLTTPHLGLSLLWILIFLNMSLANVGISLYPVPLISYICLIYIETSAGISIGKIW